ncbi:hypothetical protein T265_12393 [Opisthorchis viverrini]|uniref:Uncharacterized protein n=1 Tax=Opisthorchis viverrini TaxID=6198 RepID=A0A074YTA2_OPIVI|nr:hypothetical protein T265_12393 [Opisthorchis viverrini]KER18026.1 hypothetical protein T265_12393 [Opisthorchis viverrini]
MHTTSTAKQYAPSCSILKCIIPSSPGADPKSCFFECAAELDVATIRRTVFGGIVLGPDGALIYSSTGHLKCWMNHFELQPVWSPRPSVLLTAAAASVTRLVKVNSLSIS